MVRSTRTTHKRKIFRDFVIELAKLSTCKRAQVGAIIFPEDYSCVVAIGYNGQPRSINHDCCTEEPGNCGCVHAEANALIKPAHHVHSQNLTLLTTTSPCVHCAGLIINDGRITTVGYMTDYRDSRGLDTLRQANIKTERWT